MTKTYSSSSRLLANKRLEIRQLEIRQLEIRQLERMTNLMFYRQDRKMSDGRTLRYYDQTQVARLATDNREPSEPALIGEMRRDLLVDEWVAVAAHRQGRAFLPPKAHCPLCPSSPENITEIPDSDYQVVVFDNKSPSFSTPPNDFAIAALADLAVDKLPAAGKCEVVCFTPAHEGSFGELSIDQISLVMEAWRDRTAELSELPYIQAITPFENRGEEVGVTLNHPHGQIYAYPFIPSKLEREIKASEKFLRETGKNLAEFILERELKDQVRIVAENEDWVAFVPFAARYPYEIHLYPRVRKPNLISLDEKVAKNFAPIAKEVLRRLDGVLNLPMPYIAAWHQAPTRSHHDLLGVHWQITSIRRAENKLKYLAGSESAMGAFIMDVTPEDAAARLREVVR